MYFSQHSIHKLLVGADSIRFVAHRGAEDNTLIDPQARLRPYATLYYCVQVMSFTSVRRERESLFAITIHVTVIKLIYRINSSTIKVKKAQGLSHVPVTSMTRVATKQASSFAQNTAYIVITSV